MDRSFFARALVLALMLLSPAAGAAAEIGCDLFYTEYPEKMPLMKWEPSEERDRALWPSGRRPILNVTCRYAFLDGAIVQGDYEKVLAFYRQHHPFLQNLILRSPGGDVDTAIKIGRLLRKYLILARAPTRIPGAAGTIFPKGGSILVPYDRGPGCSSGAAPEVHGLPPGFVLDAPPCACLSACALIWFGAPLREGAVGLHRPRFTDPRFAKLPPSEASAAYKQALQRTSQYLEEMEAPKTVIDAMTSTASAEISWVEDGHGLNDGIRMHRAPSIAEWSAASCGTFTHQEFRLMLQLQGITAQRQHTPQESKEYMAVFNKQENIDRCELRLISSNRDRMPPP